MEYTEVFTYILALFAKYEIYWTVHFLSVKIKQCHIDCHSYSILTRINTLKNNVNPLNKKYDF